MKLESSIIQKYVNSYNILFVGKIDQLNCQHQLIELVYILKQKVKNIKLLLIGEVSQVLYFEYLNRYKTNLDLDDEVIIAGKVSDEDLNDYYKVADIYISLSENDYFTSPLIRAMKYDIPVLVYNVGDISITVPGIGLLEKKSTFFISEFIENLLENPYKKVEFIKEQKKYLKKPSLVKNIQIQGPFDSSYSLAIVNSQLAKAVANYTSYDVSLYSTEGYGDFLPNLENLDNELLAFYNNIPYSVDITIRNLYPPRTNAMSGYHKIIGPYGWEESRFLPLHVELFNQRLTLIFTMSEYVSKVLKSSGIYTPMVSTGIVADHILHVEPAKLNYPLPKGFRLLHISSAFPRKGVDILLDAFLKLDDSFSLIIKTFPNPHNNIVKQLNDLDFKLLVTYEEGEYLYKSDTKEILLIDKDISDENIAYLYQNSNLLVAPTRGEGFGLPQAEAMLYELPVVTTAYGGQGDFCTKDTSYLVDFDFEYAKTHMNLMRSYWVEPKADSLILQINRAKKEPQEILKQKTKKAKEYILQNYSSYAVAKKIEDAIESYKEPKRDVKIALQSTYNEKCGIAEYSKYLISGFKTKPFIFAPTNSQKLKDDDENIIRCWENGLIAKDMSHLKEELLVKGITDFIIQYNFGFYTLALLKDLILFCHTNSIKTYLFMHSTAPIVSKDISLESIKDSLKYITQIFVHTLKDLNYLKSLNLYKNTQLFFHGIDIKYMLKPKEIKKERSVILNFGFSLPQKGILELIEALEILHKQNILVELMLLNAIHPDPSSSSYNEIVKEKIASSPIEDYVTLNNDFLSENEIMKKLQYADMVTFPYQTTQESSSAAVRFGIMAQKPVVVTPLDIFEDIQDIAIFTDSITPNDIAKTLKRTLEQKNSYDLKKHQEWIELHKWENVSTNLYNYISAS